MNGQIDAAHIRSEIRATGYTVVHGAIDEGEIRSMRDYWIDAFRRDVDHAPMIWGPYLGEPNRKIFDTRDSHCLYRSFDYLWNEPYDTVTRRVALDLNRVRNRVAEFDERDGETFDADGYGVYVTTSYYPCGSGRLHRHEDAMEGRDHWHFVVPLTFRGTDYEAGGLKLVDRGGNEVDVDDRVRPGSVLFYDGRLPHWVDLIEGADEWATGRLQMFAIPVRFQMPYLSDRMGAELPLGTVLRSKASRWKWRLMGKRGL